MLPEMDGMIADLKERGAEVIAISDDDQALSLARTPFKLPVTVPEWVSPLISIIPGQLFAMNLAHVRDYRCRPPARPAQSNRNNYNGPRNGSSGETGIGRSTYRN